MRGSPAYRASSKPHFAFHRAARKWCNTLEWLDLENTYDSRRRPVCKELHIQGMSKLLFPRRSFFTDNVIPSQFLRELETFSPVQSHAACGKTPLAVFLEHLLRPI